MARWYLTARRVRFLATAQSTELRRERQTFFRDALLVHLAENDGPVNLARVLLLQKERLGLAVDETENLDASANVDQ